MALGLPHDAAPTGWYQVCWSDDLEVGSVRPFEYFGRELVGFRGESGAVRVFDGHCPHLGAHLGYGGEVQGEDIVCPFHGWTFGPDGVNTGIPYADKPMRTQRLGCWATTELNGWVMVWFDALGRPPSWTPPVLAELAEGTHRLVGRHTHERVRIQPQFVVENMVDAAHQEKVHQGTHPLEIFEHHADAHVFSLQSRLRIGVGKKSTWLSPDGETTVQLDMEAYGLGNWITRHRADSAIHVQNTTPIDATTSNSFANIYAPNSDDEAEVALQEKRCRFQLRQLDNDMVIWEHMRYQPKPPLAGFEVRPYRDFRRWASQFYVDETDGTPLRLAH